MPDVTVSGAGRQTLVHYDTLDAYSYAQTLAAVISNGLQAGSTVPEYYVSGSTAPAPADGGAGVVFIDSSPANTVAIPTADVGVVINALGPTSVIGGAAGGMLVAGSGGLTYTDITPSGDKVDYITAGDGVNVISTSSSKSGNYQINTGAGNDVISVYGNSMINAGTGVNSISVSGGPSFIYSEGNDYITATTVDGGAGADTVVIGSGQATINPGATNFFIYANTVNDVTNPIKFLAGTGSDTISVGSGGGDVVAGSGGNSMLFGGTGLDAAPVTLHGTASGDQIFAINSGEVTAYAGAGNETISGAGGALNGFTVPGSTANNTFYAGSGNDTLIAGTGYTITQPDGSKMQLSGGQDTLIGGSGSSLMVSGTGSDTFEFNFGSGGKDTITGFKPTDKLQLNGFGITSAPITNASGGVVISLADGTQITLSDTTSIDPKQIILK